VIGIGWREWLVGPIDRFALDESPAILRPASFAMFWRRVLRIDVNALGGQLLFLLIGFQPVDLHFGFSLFFLLGPRL